ncbi:MAG: hypothetical protein AAGH89_05465 [Verrucomicrobiota bacterium]
MSFFAAILLPFSFAPTTADARLKSRTEIEEDNIRRNYDERRTRGVLALNKMYLVKFEEERKRLFQAGELENVKLVQEAIELLKTEVSFIERTTDIRRGRIPRELVIEALVDGSDELVVSKHGLSWISYGAAKVGRHQGRDEPTYLNQEEWRPNWEESRKDRGRDASAVRRQPMIPDLLQFQLLAIGPHQGSTGIEERSPIANGYNEEDERYVVTIPDGQSSSRWYRFRLFYPDLPAFSQDLPKQSNLAVVTEYLTKRRDGVSKLNVNYLEDLGRLRTLYLKDENLQNAERIQQLTESIEQENEVLSSTGISS